MYKIINILHRFFRDSVLLSGCMIFAFCSLSNFTVFAQNSNVTISTSATSGGSWSPATGSGVSYVFTPSANSANINVSDIPFSGQKIEDQTLNKTDVKFDIRNFPNKLNQMLFEFTKLHIISKQ